MREYLIVQLKDLVKTNQIDRIHAQEVLELYDEEEEGTSEATAMDKAQQDIEIIIQGEWQ